MEKLKMIKPGLYKHYKGQYYQVLYDAKCADTLQIMVVYKALYYSEQFGASQIWIREINDFNSIVVVNGESKPRFQYMGLI